MIIKQAVILAGGMGKRLAPFTDDNPKPMYPIHGIPFIGYLIEQVKQWDIEEVLILLGYKGEKIIQYLGDGGIYGIRVKYLCTPVAYDTGARLKDAFPMLKDHFLLMYCDNICPINLAKLVGDYSGHKALIQLSVYSNEDGYTKSNLKLNPDGKVLFYDKQRRTKDLKGVDIGYAVVSRQAVAMLPEGNCSFEAEIYPQLVGLGKMYATITHHRYYSIGSWERIKLTEEFLQTRKVVFLDRDGTLNVRPPKACYVERPEDFKWLDGAKEAIYLLKKYGYEIYLVSNQPGIARGNLSERMLGEIHQKMQDELRNMGASLDGIYYCPHDWNTGCFCRKPNPGLFYYAQRDHSLNLSQCIMIGDDERDMQAAQAAGIKGILVSNNYSLLKIVKNECI